MIMLKALGGASGIVGLGMVLTLSATGILTFLWTLQGLVRKRVSIWVYDQSAPAQKRFIRPALKGYFGRPGLLKKPIERLANLAFRILSWHEERLFKSGMTSSLVGRRARQWCLSILGISLFLLFRDLGHPTSALLFCSTLTLYFWWVTGSKIKVRKDTFVTGVYKIYRHMALQISSGMSSPEAIKYLHESVEEPFLKEAMYRFSSCYFKTMDIDLALRELTERIEGDEVQVLATVLRQGLQTGDSYEMIIKQEQLMVKRYYAALSATSERIRTKGILIAIGLCILIFLLLAAPMVYEMGRATQSIFSGQ